MLARMAWRARKRVRTCKHKQQKCASFCLRQTGKNRQTHAFVLGYVSPFSVPSKKASHSTSRVTKCILTIPPDRVQFSRTSFIFVSGRDSLSRAIAILLSTRLGHAWKRVESFRILRTYSACCSCVHLCVCYIRKEGLRMSERTSAWGMVRQQRSPQNVA